MVDSSGNGKLSIDPGFDFLPRIEGLTNTEYKQVNSQAFGAMIIPIIIRQTLDEANELEAETSG